MKKRLFLAAAAAAAVLGSYAQINSPSADGYLHRAVEMFRDGNYFGCLDQLTNVDDAALTADEVMLKKYYRAIATVHTDRVSAIHLLNKFIDEYPSSMLLNEARMALGDCYYGPDYAKALSIYRTVNPDALDDAKFDDLLFRMAFCDMRLENYSNAENMLEQLANSPEYGVASKFYKGYIAYCQGKYKDAEAIFKEVDNSKAPGNMGDFYLSQIYYQRGDYAKALGMAKNIMGRSGIEPEFEAEAYRVAGESAYEMGQDTQAISYLDKYVGMTEAPMPSALYILGLNAYNKGMYDLAIEYLRPATQKNDAMGQSAYLYLGQAYMKKNDFRSAVMAFDHALSMDYDKGVQETAYYNYAVASMQGGKAPFANTVKIFSNFLQKYPNSKYAPNVQEYIITSYITDNNYADALKSINEMRNPSEATLAAKQHVLYALGNKALAQSKYAPALKYLVEASTLSKYDATTAREVSLSLGEAYYRNGQYQKAQNEIKKYLAEAPADAQNRHIAYYDLGYAQYALKEYSKAAANFDKVINDARDLPSNVVADAWNRLGDCYYFQTDFSKAAAAYDKAYEVNPSAGDYSLFQKALMAGYERNYNQKLATLQELQKKFPTSALIPDALLETTESYIQLGQNANAINTYKDLVLKYPNTAQCRQGYLQMALVMYNNNDRSGAEKAYKEVISRYPTSEEAQQAVEHMKRLTAADGTLREFTAFLETVKDAPHLNESDIEKATYENAEMLYLTEDELQALEDFVETYPESNMRPRALAYLTEGFMEQGDADAAYDYANALASQYPDNSYTQNALTVKATVEEQRGAGNQAMRTWMQLADIASSPEMLLNARMGIIRNGLDSNDYNEVYKAATAVLASSGIGADDITEATYSLGYVLAKQGDKNQARELWESVADNVDNVYGAQSLYQLGQSFFDDKDYTSAEKWAETLAYSDTPYQYWMARGFILLSDVYVAQGEKQKAREYLEAVKKNYGGTEEDIFTMIDQRLK